MPWNEENQNPSLEAFQRRVRSLARRYNSLVERISEVEFLADAIQLELAELTGSYEPRSGGTSESIAPGARGNRYRRRQLNGPGQDAREALRRTAEAGAITLMLKERTDGFSDVCVDEGRVFALPPSLADLLAVLALDSRLTDDQFVGWKTLDEIAILLKKRTGKLYTRHGVTQSIYRLRNKLYHLGGVNPFLVQTNPRFGARFALKRKVFGVVTTSVGQTAARAIQDERRDEWHTSG